MATGGRGGDGDARAESSNGISRLDGVRVLVVESQPQVLDLVTEALGLVGLLALAALLVVGAWRWNLDAE